MYHEMRILLIRLKLRYPLNPNYLSGFNPSYLSRFSSSFILRTAPSFKSSSKAHSAARYSSIFPTGCRCGYGYGYRYGFGYVVIARRFLGGYRFFSSGLPDQTSLESDVSSSGGELALNEVSVRGAGIDSIVDLVRRNEGDMEFCLNAMGQDIPKPVVIQTLRTLNRLGLNAFRFYSWIRNAIPQLSGDSVLCSLMVDNCGRLEDYQQMITLLQDFTVAGISLTNEAFGFLSNSTKEEVERSVMVLVKILKEANGICYRSCIETLIKTLCALNSFDIAKIVIEMSNREAVYFNILVRECCLKGQFQEARDTLCEMRQIGYDPDVRTYNYLISCLLKHQRGHEACSVLKEMKEIGCHPNAITYEVLICQSCKGEDLEKAVKLYQIMVSNGVEPRFSTCSAIIQAYFDSQKFDEAYEYVVHVSLSQRWLTNRVYSFLANLHRKHGNYVVAYDLLMELIQKGLKPDFEVYVKLSKDLYKSRKKDLARVLKDGFNSLVHQSSKK